MGKHVDLVGKHFGKLVVVGKTSLKKRGKDILWACHCDCMNFILQTTEQLTSLGKIDCGCGFKERKSKAAIKHGCSIVNNKVYSIYKTMISRCENPLDKNYQHYGGRGIEVCDRWQDVKNFFEDMEDSYQEGLSLDRLDVDGNYEPSNCAWKDNSWQAYNKRKMESNTSGKTGVSWCKDRYKWEAYIAVDGKKINLGRYDNYEDAVKVREEAEIKYFGRLKGN